MFIDLVCTQKTLKYTASNVYILFINKKMLKKIA